MKNTMLIQPVNAKVVELLHQLEELHLIKIVENNTVPLSLADKYLGILTEEQGESLDAHIKQIRNEWKKPSDYFGTLSIEEGEKFHKYLKKTRDEWQRNKD